MMGLGISLAERMIFANFVTAFGLLRASLYPTFFDLIMNTPLSLRGLCSCLLVAASALAALAGRIVPTSMRLLADDMTGQLSHVRDAQGRECALVKVKIPYEGAEFGGVIKTEARPGFYNVWIEDGNKMMEIYFPNCDPVRVHFGDLMTPAGVVAPRTYELDIDADALEFVANPAAPRDLGQDFAIFTLSPKPTGAALLIINGTNVSFDAQGRAMMLLPYGSHNFQIMADGFANYSGQVTVNKGGATNLTVELKSTQGILAVNCATSGSTITVQDDRKSSSGSWSGKLPAGSYKVDISKQGYHSVTQIAAVEAGQECNLNIPALTPITGSLAVQVTPIGSTVKVDGKEAGTTPIVLRDLLIGTHNIEVTAPGYDPYTTTLTIAEGPDNPALTATLTETPTETSTDYSKLSLTDLRRRAEAGDPEAQAQLGNKYHYGDGVTRNFDEAVKLYRQAAEQGNALAQYGLGCMYQYGFGVTEDYSEAVKWYRKAATSYRKAAEQGDADAQYMLGWIHDISSVIQDYSEAAKWYRKAAEQGHVRAQVFLGEMYEEGAGVTQDYSEAVKWYRKAAEQGDADAQYFLSDMYQRGAGVTQDNFEADKWRRKAAEQGYISGPRCGRIK